MNQNTLQIKMKQERRKFYLPQCRERDTLDSSQQICSYLQSQCMDNGQQKTYAEKTKAKPFYRRILEAEE
nr:hypothetical protein Iba_scaffold16223CG0040 [Ipomoea batatas]